MNADFFNPQLIEIASPAISSLKIGELFLEETNTDIIYMNNNKIEKNTSSKIFGSSIRGVVDNTTYFYSIDNINEQAITNLSNKLLNHTVKGKANSFNGFVSGNFYKNTFEDLSNEQKIELMHEINSYVRKNSLIQNVEIFIPTSVQKVVIYNSKGNCIYDFRPMCRLIIKATIEHQQKTNTVYCTWSQRNDSTNLLNIWQNLADELLRKADVISRAKKLTSGGNKKVILGSGDPGILLHEAMGHGFEGDFNRKGISAFSGLIGQKIAKDMVTIVDDGTCMNARGSINFDDEGNTGQKNILVENGVLTKYMCDEKNGNLLGIGSTGSGRRQDYSYEPIPRMTNTYMLPGQSTFEEMLSEMGDGIYVKGVSHGQVEIASGQFAFICSEAYEVNKGKIGGPLLDMSITGVGIDVMRNIQMVSRDFKLAPCGGTCGKDGQWVPVGVGQPDVLVSSILCG